MDNQAEHCNDVPSTVLQPPEILKASTLWDISLTCIRCFLSSCSAQHASVITQSPYRLSTRLIAILILSSEQKQLIDGLSKQNLTTNDTSLILTIHTG